MVDTIATPTTIKTNEKIFISNVDSVNRSCKTPNRRKLKTLLKKKTKSGRDDCAVTTSETGPKLTDNMVRKIAKGTINPSFNKIIRKLLRVVNA